MKNKDRYEVPYMEFLLKKGLVLEYLDGLKIDESKKMLNMKEILR